MNKIKDGATLKKVEDTTEQKLPAVKMANAEGNKIEAIRLLNGVLGQRLGNLDKLYETQEKVEAFDPKNPEVKIGIVIEDSEGNKFVTSNPLLIERTLQVIAAEVRNVIAEKENEVVAMAM